VSYATPDDFICEISEQDTLCLLASHEPALADADIGLLRQALVDGFCDASLSINVIDDVIEVTAKALEIIPAFVSVSKYPTGFRVTNPNDETSSRFAIGVSKASFATGTDATGVVSGTVKNPGWNFVAGQLWVGMNGEITDIYPDLPFDIPIGSVIDTVTMLVDNDQVIQN
jgi:hypothetical protein